MSDKSISLSEHQKNMGKIAGWLIINNKKYKERGLYNYFNRVDTLENVRKLAKDRYMNKKYVADGVIAEYTECLIEDNKKDLSFLPAYVTGSDGTKYYKNAYVSMAQRVSAYEVYNGRSPSIVYIEDPKGNGTTSKTVNNTLQSFEKLFGKVTDFDSCLRKIQGKGYAYYYNSRYNTIETLNRIYHKRGVNCTDSSQLFYRLAIALGYEVHFVHVYDHIRLRLKHKINSKNKWFDRDPAAVLKGNNITHLWRKGYKVKAIDPGWIFSDLYQ